MNLCLGDTSYVLPVGSLLRIPWLAKLGGKIKRPEAVFLVVCDLSMNEL
jgi:hypothetical protein